MRNNYLIQTNFNDKKELIIFINKPIFFKKIIEKINPDNCVYIPELNLEKNIIKWPQKIEYEEIPKLSILNLPKLKIVQTWELKNNILEGIIESYHNELHLFTIKLEGKIIESHCILIDFNAFWKHKHFMVPDFILPEIINNLKKTIANVLDIKNTL